MTARPRPLGTAKPPEGYNAPPGWSGYVATRDLNAQAPGLRYRAWGTGWTTAEGRRLKAIMRAAVRTLRRLPGPRHKRGRFPVDIEGADVEPERVAGWRRYAGLPMAVVAGSTEPLEVLLRIMRGERV